MSGLRCCGRTGLQLPPETRRPSTGWVSWHALRHTYASLCIAAGRPPLEIARFMGHAKVTTTLAVYAHLLKTDDHAEAMDALDAMAAATTYGEKCHSLAKFFLRSAARLSTNGVPGKRRDNSSLASR